MLSTITHQEIIGAIAFLIGLSGTVIYIRSILIRKTKPHLYTWMVFSILTTIAFLAQIYDHGGPGSWTTGMTAFSCICIAILAIKFGTKDVHKSDKFSLFFSLSAIIPWFITKDPLLSVIMISLIDSVAMVPTLRKSWNNPHDENLTSYVIANIKTILSVAALTNLTLVTTLYPIAIIIVNFALIFLCLWRRKVLMPPPHTT